ncbi:unnamed protein product [Calypogeia fissa]
MGKRRLIEGGDEGEVKEPEAGSEDETPVEVRPIGEVIKRSNKGKAERRHYAAVELDAVRYDLEDAVLVAPEQRGEKPYVAIIKEIKQAKDGSVAVTGQWFYRPEEAEKKGGGAWTSFDTRELFYSFHRDEVPAESVMHKCVVHFIPPQKKSPLRSKHPGFIIRQVYDTVEKKLWKLTDKDYEDSKQKEIDLLVEKTREALGELPDIDVVEVVQGTIDAEEADKNRRQQGRRRAVPPTPISVTKEDSGDMIAKGDPPLSAKGDTPSTPGSGFPSDVMDLLRAHNALTGQTARDRWLEKIVRTLKSVLDSDDQKPMEAGEAGGNPQQDPKPTLPSTVESETVGGNDGDGMRKGNENLWPASAISAGSALEQVVHEFNVSDVHKYNLKMRSLDFNLKKSLVLAHRLLSKDLEPATVLHMTPVELKDGFTAAEKKAREPPELETLQMTATRCKVCGEREVGVKDIIHVGYGDRYQLECLKCGTSWYGSRDSVSTVTTDDQVNVSPVGLAPWATSKFEEVEKELQSPRESERPPAGQESLQTVPEGAEETQAPESHYAEVERMLTEPIALSGPGLSGQDHSNLEGETKGADEKQNDNNDLPKPSEISVAEDQEIPNVTSLQTG